MYHGLNNQQLAMPADRLCIMCH